MSQGRPATEPATSEATLPLPRAEEPATVGGPAGATLVSPPPPSGVADTIVAGSTADNNGDLTEEFNPAAVQTLKAAILQARAASLGPSDATLIPDDDQSQAFHAAAQQGAKGPAITTGASFGHYELIAPIAKGGMGIVYKARQRNLNRIVAIKMILAGQFADQTDVDRFYAEAEAAAALSHPNIVAIHEIGQVQGQHFFSMDFIDGKSLAALVQENPLKPRQAAEFCRTIAETMQFAHDSGIIHRDLKPSNILLDKKQRPLITDFGLAKHVSNQSQITIAGGVVGTPSYMPPEQAAGKGNEVGPWSDLYSLGAILYECLTGRPPFRASSPFETIRQVIEVEPVAPSVVNPGLPRDVETICLKCLQKDRTRRYASAQEMADELGRFIRGEPIQARPISNVERFWRLCKRYPATSASIAVAVLLLIATAGISTAAYIKTSAALAEADLRLDDAMQAVDDLLTEASNKDLLNLPGGQLMRDRLYRKAKDYYEGFLKSRSNEPRIQIKLARGYFKVGEITELLQSVDDAVEPYTKARELLERLTRLRPNDLTILESLGETLNKLGTIWIRKKDFEAARRDLEKAVSVRQRLVSLDNNNVEYQRVLANTYMNIGLAEYNAAQVEQNDDKYKARLAEARRQYEEAQKIRLAALKREPENSKLRRDLAKCYFSLGNLDYEDQDAVAAEKNFKSAATEFEKLVAEQDSEIDNLENQRNLAVCCSFVGDILRRGKNWDEARIWYRKALAQLDPLAAQNPDVVDYQTERAGLLMSMFDLESQAGDAKAARSALEQAHQILAGLATRFPGEPRYQRDLAVTLRELAKVQDAAGEHKLAADNLQEAIRILAALVAQYPQESDYATLLEEAKAVMLSAAAN